MGTLVMIRETPTTVVGVRFSVHHRHRVVVDSDGNGKREGHHDDSYISSSCSCSSRSARLFGGSQCYAFGAKDISLIPFYDFFVMCLEFSTATKNGMEVLIW